MRTLSRALILSSLAVAAAGTAFAQTTGGTTTGSQSTTVTNEQTQKFIARFDAPVRACIERCVEGHPITPNGTTLSTDGNTWTLQQFSSQFDEPVRACITGCDPDNNTARGTNVPTTPETSKSSNAAK